MTTPHRWTAVASFAAVLAVPVAVAVQSGGAQPAAQEWPTVTGASGNMRYSTLDQINAQTVPRLGGAWTSEKLEAAASSRAMPVVKGGLMFFTAPPFVYALDAKTGKTVWRYGARPATGAGRGGGPASSPAREGVAVAEGLVFVGLSDARVVALREKTGELVWNQYFGDNPRDKGQVISGAPLYSAGLVTVGLSADNGWRGQVVALDPKTGKEAWRFFAIPGTGEKGHDSWPSNEVWRRGGGAVWLVGTDDPETGSIYYVTGNGVPQLGGEGRPGSNLYLCSVIALDAKTGALKWHYQVIHHDIWEGDISISPVLYDAQADGRSRKGIAAMRADGYLFMLDRETGQPLTKVEERRVAQDAAQKTAATQPFPVGADRVLEDCDSWRKQATPKGFEIGCFFTPALVQKPNVLAPAYGMRVAPMAYSPQTGYFYATGASSLAWLRRADDPYFFSNSFNSRVPGLAALGHGVLAAIDSRTNKVVWKKEYRPGRPSGAMVTAGGLLFQAAPDGNLEALDAKTGNRLWQFQTGAAAGPLTILRRRRRAIRSGDRRGQRVGAQARGHAAAGGAAGAGRAGTVRGTRDGNEPDRNRVARARQRLPRLPLLHRRIRVCALPGEGQGRHAGHVAQQRPHGPHHRGAGRLVDDGTAADGRRRRHDVRQARQLHLHLQGTPVGVRAGDRGMNAG